MGPSDETRLRRARQLLDLLADTGEEPDAGPSRWDLPVAPPPIPDSRFSATDLLSWWFRAPGNQPDAWSAFLGDRRGSRMASARQAGGWPAAEPAPRGEPADPSSEPPPGLEEPDWWELLGGAEPEETLADEHAEAAAECLYEFLHAIGRREVDAAIALVSDDYHTMEDDEEIDKLGLRQRIERLLDSLLGFDLDISLAAAPEPLFHPQGVLIAADIQFDACRPSDGTRRSRVERRVAVLRREAGDRWQIAALSLVPA